MKKTMKVVRSIFVWLIVILAVCMMVFTIISTTMFDQSNRDLFGYKAFIVLSDSMSKTDFSAGDLVIVKEVDPSTLDVGDIVAYVSQNTDNYGEVVTHKIRSFTYDAAGEPGFVTYGTTTDIDDELIVTYGQIVGKYQTSIPKVGSFFQFLKTTPGYIICILIPFMVLILIQALNSIRLFKKYKQDQLEEMAAEKEKLKAERAESQRLMEEVLSLKAQLQGQDSGPDAEAHAASGNAEVTRDK